MEAWKEELYHFGIKGMKWKKRKSSPISRGNVTYDALKKAAEYDRDPNAAEKAGRNFETAARRYDAVARQTYAKYNGKGPDSWSSEDVHNVNAEYGRGARAAAYLVRANKKYKPMSHEQVVNKVKAYNRKQKIRTAKYNVKKFVNKLFKKKG